MTRQPGWTEAAIAGYALSLGFAPASDEVRARLHLMTQRASDAAGNLPRDFDHEHQPAFTFRAGD